MQTKPIFGVDAMDFTENIPKYDTLISMMEAREAKIFEARQEQERKKELQLKSHINYSYNSYMSKIIQKFAQIQQEYNAIQNDENCDWAAEPYPNFTSLMFEYHYPLCGCEDRNGKQTGIKEAKIVLSMVMKTLEVQGYSVFEEYCTPSTNQTIKIKCGIKLRHSGVNTREENVNG